MSLLYSLCFLLLIPFSSFVRSLVLVCISYFSFYFCSPMCTSPFPSPLSFYSLLFNVATHPEFFATFVTLTAACAREVTGVPFFYSPSFHFLLHFPPFLSVACLFLLLSFFFFPVSCLFVHIFIFFILSPLFLP